MKKDKAGKIKSVSKKKKSAKPLKTSSAAVAASKNRSATEAVKPDSNTDVRGSSGLANTGPVVTYNDGE